MLVSYASTPLSRVILRRVLHSARLANSRNDFGNVPSPDVRPRELMKLRNLRNRVPLHYVEEKQKQQTISSRRTHPRVKRASPKYQRLTDRATGNKPLGTRGAICFPETPRLFLNRAAVGARSLFPATRKHSSRACSPSHRHFPASASKSKKTPRSARCMASALERSACSVG